MYTFPLAWVILAIAYLFIKSTDKKEHFLNAHKIIFAVYSFTWIFEIFLCLYWDLLFDFIMLQIYVERMLFRGLGVLGFLFWIKFFRSNIHYFRLILFYIGLIFTIQIGLKGFRFFKTSVSVISGWHTSDFSNIQYKWLLVLLPLLVAVNILLQAISKK